MSGSNTICNSHRDSPRLQSVSSILPAAVNRFLFHLAVWKTGCHRIKIPLQITTITSKLRFSLLICTTMVAPSISAAPASGTVGRCRL
ncbi:hypothetical protein SDJN02_11549, partial [Cucurbita argyrosperma subsp. argyrosperma]